MKVIGYIRVSTEDQADSGAGLEAQRLAIRDHCRRRNWQLITIRSDTASGRSLTSRPGLGSVLSDLERGAASALVVAKLDRLSRSLLDFASLMDRSRKKGWALVALDLGVDTTTPAGEMMASVVATVAQYERRLIGARTKEALAVKRLHGVRLGRPPVLAPSILKRIEEERAAGKSMAAIAAGLDADAVATAHGGRSWRISTIQGVLRRVQRPRTPGAR